jgi:hypothetical protein
MDKAIPVFLSVSKENIFTYALKDFFQICDVLCDVCFLIIFAGCFVAALYQAYQLKEMLDRRKLQEQNPSV